MGNIKNGGDIRWINTAGFEIAMANGKHILIDPFITGNFNGIECHPMPIHDIKACEYLILSHTHSDHAADVHRIQKKFPKTNIFIGDLSADALCEEQGVDCGRMYRVRSGEKYEFDDVKIEIFSGRHTESPRGYFRHSRDFQKPDGSLDRQQWLGNLEFLNYRLTLCDGTTVLVWGGMRSADQKHKFEDMNVNIALMQVSPKQDFEEFANLVKAIRAQIVIPHHYDFTQELFKVMPQSMDAMSEENKKNFIENGMFRMDKYMEALGEKVREKAPETDIITLDHHKWYSFGFSVRLREASE